MRAVSDLDTVAGMVHPLRAYRKRHGLSQKKLGEMLGRSRTTIVRWEAWERMPDADELSEISEKTGIPARELRPDLAKILEGA